MKIPLLDLKKQYANFKPQILKAIENVVESGQFIMGPDIETFENEVKDFMGVKYALGVSNGTDALYMSLKALGVGPGDLVLTTPFTFFATASAICNTGAKPIFADIQEDSFNIDPIKVEEVLKKDLTGKIKVILPVHLYGQSAEMNALQSLSTKYGVKIVEDAAQSIGTKYQGKMVGGLGSYGCFSLFPTKNLGAMGDAGLLVTNDETMYRRIKMIRVHGAQKQYHHDIIGSNFRMDTMQAAVLRVFLPQLNSWISARQRLAERYASALSGMEEVVQAPSVSSNSTHTYHQYTIRVKNGLRESLKNLLTQKEIASCIYYPIPVHLQKALMDLNLSEGSFPVAEKASREVLSLPVHPMMTFEEQDYVIDAIKTWALEHSRSFSSVKKDVERHPVV